MVAIYDRWVDIGLQWGRGSDASEDAPRPGSTLPPMTLQWGRGSDASEDLLHVGILGWSHLVLQWGRGSDASEDRERGILGVAGESASMGPRQ